LYAIETGFEVVGDDLLLIRASEGLRDVRGFNRKVGVQLMSSAVRRLIDGYSTDNNVRSGFLAASLRVGQSGSGGTGDTIFDVGDDYVEVGSSMPYAAQHHFGGTITPTTGKSLAIPIPDSLKRAGLWPRDLDPGRDKLTFIPEDDGGNTRGYLVDDEGLLGFGKGPLFVLVAQVTQPPRPFLYVGDEDLDVIVGELWPQHLGLS